MLECFTTPKGVQALVTSKDWEVRCSVAALSLKLLHAQQGLCALAKIPTRPTRLSAVLELSVAAAATTAATSWHVLTATTDTLGLCKGSCACAKIDLCVKHDAKATAQKYRDSVHAKALECVTVACLFAASQHGPTRAQGFWGVAGTCPRAEDSGPKIGKDQNRQAVSSVQVIGLCGG